MDLAQGGRPRTFKSSESANRGLPPWQATELSGWQQTGQGGRALLSPHAVALELDKPGRSLQNVVSFLACPRRTWRERIVAQLLLIDDDPDLIAEQVRLAFPRHRVEVAATGA